MLNTLELQVEAIMKYINQFMDDRFNQAIRINPRIEDIRPDLEWQQKMQLELILRSTKSLGIEKYIVASILVGDKELLKRRLMAPTDQLSIFHEVYDIDDETKSSSTLAIHNMKTLYHAFDPTLENITLMVQCWILWDLMDASEFARMYDDIGDVNALLKSEHIPESLEKAYRNYKKIENPSIEVSWQDIMVYKWHSIKQLFNKRSFDLSEEPAYKMVIHREKSKKVSFDSLIVKYYQELARVHKIKKEQKITEEEKQNFAMQMGVNPEDVTLELALTAADEEMSRIKKDLDRVLQGKGVLGKPYNLKKHLLEKVKEPIATLRKHPRMESIIKKEREEEQKEAQSE